MSQPNNTNNDIKTITNSLDKKPIHGIIRFWAITVIANSLLGAFTYIGASKSDYLGVVGMVSAILSCIVIYSMAEIYLRQKNQNQLATELRITACFRIILQPISDLSIGLLAVALTQNAFKIIAPLLHSNSEPFLHNLPVGFISTYITTMVHAVIASLLVFCILGIVKLLIYLYGIITWY